MEFITGEDYDEVCNRYRDMLSSNEFRNGSFEVRRNLINAFRSGKM